MIGATVGEIFKKRISDNIYDEKPIQIEYDNVEDGEIVEIISDMYVVQDIIINNQKNMYLFERGIIEKRIKEFKDTPTYIKDATGDNVENLLKSLEKETGLDIIEIVYLAGEKNKEMFIKNNILISKDEVKEIKNSKIKDLKLMNNVKFILNPILTNSKINILNSEKEKEKINISMKDFIEYVENNPEKSSVVSMVTVINNVDYLNTGTKVLLKDFNYTKKEKQKVILGTTSFIIQGEYLDNKKMKLKFFFIDKFEHALKPTNFPNFQPDDIEGSINFGILLKEKEMVIKLKDLNKIKRKIQENNKTLEEILKDLK
ncbi:hypothetical protein STFE110948_06850 [Streptobacillus felis]